MTLATQTSGSLARPLASSPVAVAVAVVSCAAIVASIPPLMAVGFDYEKFYSEGYNAYSTPEIPSVSSTILFCRSTSSAG